MRRPVALAGIGVGGLATFVVLMVSGSAPPSEPGDSTGSTVSSSQPGATTTTAASSSSTAGATAPPPGPRYVVPDNEVEREAKQLASDIAYALTTYEATDDPNETFFDIAGAEGLDDLTEIAQPLIYPGQWSRGQIVYPQLGGLTSDKVSVMTVTSQTVGSGVSPEFSVVRTLDIRLIKGDAGWEFDRLASAGGAFESLEALQLAHAVAADPRIEMPDSARLDILDGLISPVLLEVMLDIADITPYAITVMATGHPIHVFETNRVSHHTGGRAIDIHRVGDNLVIDDRHRGSGTWNLVRWLWEDPRMVQVGSPWDIDEGPTRSFANTVHQDHIHVAVVGPNDPRWVPAIGDRVWEDLNANGIQDSGELGIEGVTVRLFNASGTQIASTVTDATGRYEFRYLRYGHYHVAVDIPPGWFASPRDQGSNDAVDSDIDSTGVMPQTTLDPREHDPRWDAGLYRRASIGNLVWEDLDGDGIRDQGEPGVSGVTVRLLDGGGNQVASTTTNGSGEYGFANLTPGTYSVKVDIPGGFLSSPRDQGSDDTVDSDIDASGSMAQTTLTSGESDMRWDAGLVRPVVIGDLVWEDDGDGIQQPGEPGIPGVTVRLFTSGGVQVASKVTDATGEYLFTGVRPGTYYIVVVIPDGFVASPKDQGSDDELDSDIDATGKTATFTLLPGVTDRDWDAGLIAPP